MDRLYSRPGEKISRAPRGWAEPRLGSEGSAGVSRRPSEYFRLGSGNKKQTVPSHFSMEFKTHAKETAPEASIPVLEQTEKAYGFALNLFGVLAESPAALSAYVQINQLLEEHAALSPEERQVVMLTVSEVNRCEYCVSAHTAVAGIAGLDKDTIEALRAGKEPSDSRHAALVRFSKALIEHRGWVPEEEQEAFLKAGFTTRHVLDVITILALKTLSNTTNHLARTELDEAFQSARWSAPS